jgi:small subunit ribosomal protein S16
MSGLCGFVGALPGVTRATSIAIPAEHPIPASPRWFRHARTPHPYTRRQYSMAVVIRMMRAGAKKRPFYRVVVADSRRQRDGRFVEILGYYDPIAKPFAFKIDEDKVKGWIAQGAQPSEQAASLLRKHGIIAARPSRPTKSADAAKGKGPVKRAKPRKAKTERKARNKAARVRKKANPKQRQPKKK